MAAKLGIAIIGCGRVSKLHVRGWQESKLPVEIRALVDVKPELARKLKDTCRLKTATVYTDYRRVLAKKDIDAVEICTYSDLHTEQIIAALTAGKHILTEKPVGYSLEDCRKLRWCRQHYPDPKVGVAYSLRYYPVNQAVKRELEAGTIGKPMYASVCHNHPHGGLEDIFDFGPEYAIHTDFGGRYIAGSEMSHATHPFDFARWLMGEVVDVLAVRQNYGVFATFRHANGGTSHVIGGTAAKGGLSVPYPLCIQGTRGTIFTQNVPGKEAWTAGAFRGTVVVDGKARDITPDFVDTGHADVSRCRNFCEAVTNGGLLICDMLDGIRTTELLHAVRDSYDHEIRVPVHRTDQTG